ncbi:MAG TPA: HD-GYP domain-containing protein [Solirubrobacteraceae bacterium]|nr:HD-GYP domain-containing protein [Solirubrobacteraceae bacterium]
MLLKPNFEEQELLAETLARDGAPMSERERVAEMLVGGGFAIAAAALLWARPPGAFALGPAVVCTVVLMLATRVRIDTPFGFTVPTQLAFVPLLFVLPPSLAPVIVALALALARLPDVFTANASPSRMLLSLGNSWFALGPAAVFALSGKQPWQAGAALLMVALAAQFALDFAASAFRCSVACGATLGSQLRDTSVYLVDAALSPLGLVVAEQTHSSAAAILSLLPLLGLLAVFAHERHYRVESLAELNSAYRGTALVLGDVVEADDGYTGEHCKSVVGLALAVADQLGLTAEQRRNLEFGALLHDVGKIAVPKEIINKPGKLSPAEWTIIRTHTLEGQRMLERVGGFMREVGLVVRSHHERWDGGGYPDGLTGEQIPLEARVIACCDTWNAMRTDRSYRRALAPEVAIAELLSCSGSQFDPRVVDALICVVDPARGASSGRADRSGAQAVLTGELSRDLGVPA